MGWLSGYQYRKKVTISGSSGAGENYQVKLKIGSSSGGDFHLEGHCEDFPNDIRFTDDDGTTLLDYWIEDASEDPITVWVEVKDSLDNDVDIYVYYGKSGESSASDGEATFLFFEDGNNLDQWTADEGDWSADGTIHQTDDTLKLWSNGLRITTPPSQDGRRVSANIKIVNTDGNRYAAFSVKWNDEDNFLHAEFRKANTPVVRCQAQIGGIWKTAHDASFDVGYNTWHRLEVGLSDTGKVKAWVDSELKLDFTDSDWDKTWTSVVLHTYLTKADFDDIFVAKFVDPEPAFSSAGSEESAFFNCTDLVGLSDSSSRSGPIIRSCTDILESASSSSRFLVAHWLPGFTYRKRLTISSSSGAGTGYQVKLKIGSSSGGDFHLEGHCDDFPNDIRFTKDDGLSLLNYWVEDPSEDPVTVWVKVEDSLDDNVDIYCYYGSSLASSISDGYIIFDLFDDFTKKLCYDSSKWDKVGSGVVRKVCETQFTASHGGQGLANDGTYFYWGRNNGTGVNGTIYKIKMNDGSEVDSFSGPPHAAGGDWRDDHSTLLFSSGGSDPPEVWEINPSTGTKIREWDFSGEGYNRGALIAYKSEERIYLFTSNSSSDFKIKEYQINDDGTWSAIGIEYSHSSLGVPQGLDYVDGYLYYLYDNGISKLQLNDDGSITILETLPNLPGGEKEGLTYFDGHFYYGDASLVIRKVLHQIACDISSNHVSLYSKNANYGTGTALRCRWRASSVTLDYPGFGYGDKTRPDIVDDSYGGKGISIGKLHSANNYLQGRQTDDGTNRAETASLCSTQDQFHILEIRRKSSSAEFVVNNESPVTLSDHYPTEDLYIGIGGHSKGESGQSIADWILVRKYVSPEPSLYNASTEEGPVFTCGDSFASSSFSSSVREHLLLCSEMLNCSDISNSLLSIILASQDSLGLVDSNVLSILIFLSTVDSIGVDDGCTLSLSFTSSCLDVLHAIDSASYPLPNVVSCLDSLGIQDSISSFLSMLCQSKDNIGGADGETSQLSIERALLDILAFQDTSSYLAGIIASASDVLNVQDLNSVRLTFSCSSIDIVKNVDSGGVNVTFHLDGNDILKGADFVSGNLQVLLDSLAVFKSADQSASSLLGFVLRSATDVLDMYDLNTATLQISSSSIDIFRTEDNSSINITLHLNSADVFKNSDSAILSLQTLLSALETLKASDSSTASVFAEILASASDLLAASDYNTVRLEFLGSALDVVGSVDNASSNVTLHLNSSDLLGGMDRVTAKLEVLLGAISKFKSSDESRTYEVIYGVPVKIFKAQHKVLVFRAE